MRVSVYQAAVLYYASWCRSVLRPYNGNENIGLLWFTTASCQLINWRVVKTPETPSQQPNEIVAARNELDATSSTRSAEISARNETVRARASSSAALLTGQRWRRAARWIGLTIFLLGALLIAWVFWQAKLNFENFSRPGYLTMRVTIAGGDTNWQQALTAYISVFGAEILRFLYLLLLGLLGSWIATKGIQFFAASESVIDEAVVPYE